MSQTITRFAPSPTGHLHIGGARTALFNYLFAKHSGGKFLLRIEDTDTERSEQQYTDAIIEGMNWLGLNYDGEITYQSKRFDHYREIVKKLLEEGKAYKCYCTAEELNVKREALKAKGEKPKYDRTCLNAEEQDKPFTVRFKIEPGITTFNDMVKGSIETNNDEIDDFIILRSDNTPTYNFVVVVDEADMKITEVLRGDDHISNTPKQILIYKALGYDIPKFGHLPMILGSDKARLSKRHGATSVMAYKEMGYLPQALINYLARLGWSSGDEEVFSKDELIEKFTVKNIGKSAGIFNPEKLLWLNQQYIIKAYPKDLIEPLEFHFDELGVGDAFKNTDQTKKEFIIKNLQERAKTLIELAGGAKFFFIKDDEIVFDEKAKTKFLTEDSKETLSLVVEGLEKLEDFTHDNIHEVFEAVMAKTELKLGKLAQPVRVALTGGTVSPSIFETIEALGKDATLTRLKKAIEII